MSSSLLSKRFARIARASDIAHDYLDYNADELIARISHSLSMLCRFCGHTKRFYSVAEHSAFCALQALQEGYGCKISALALFHDAHESILNDVNRPIKNLLGPNLKKIEEACDWFIFGRIFAVQFTEEEVAIVKQIDRSMGEVEYCALSISCPQDKMTDDKGMGVNPTRANQFFMGMLDRIKSASDGGIFQ